MTQSITAARKKRRAPDVRDPERSDIRKGMPNEEEDGEGGRVASLPRDRCLRMVESSQEESGREGKVDDLARTIFKGDKVVRESRDSPDAKISETGTVRANFFAISPSIYIPTATQPGSSRGGWVWSWCVTGSSPHSSLESPPSSGSYNRYRPGSSHGRPSGLPGSSASHNAWFHPPVGRTSSPSEPRRTRTVDKRSSVFSKLGSSSS